MYNLIHPYLFFIKCFSKQDQETNEKLRVFPYILENIIYQFDSDAHNWSQLLEFWIFQLMLYQRHWSTPVLKYQVQLFDKDARHKNNKAWVNTSVLQQNMKHNDLHEEIRILHKDDPSWFSEWFIMQYIKYGIRSWGITCKSNNFFSQALFLHGVMLSWIWSTAHLPRSVLVAMNE